MFGGGFRVENWGSILFYFFPGQRAVLGEGIAMTVRDDRVQKTGRAEAVGECDASGVVEGGREKKNCGRRGWTQVSRARLSWCGGCAEPLRCLFDGGKWALQEPQADKGGGAGSRKKWTKAVILMWYVCVWLQQNPRLEN